LLLATSRCYFWVSLEAILHERHKALTGRVRLIAVLERMLA